MPRQSYFTPNKPLLNVNNNEHKLTILASVFQRIDLHQEPQNPDYFANANDFTESHSYSRPNN